MKEKKKTKTLGTHSGRTRFPRANEHEYDTGGIPFCSMVKSLAQKATTPRCTTVAFFFFSAIGHTIEAHLAGGHSPCSQTLENEN